MNIKAALMMTAALMVVAGCGGGDETTNGANAAGAVSAGASPERCRALRKFGQDLGLAFQLVDDALDYSGDADTLGKNPGDDFREGKVTLPLLLAIPLTVLTSQIALGTALRERGFLLIPEESRSPAVLRRAWMHAVRLARPVLAVA